MPSYILSMQAKADILDAKSYIAERNPSVADRMIDELLDLLDAIASMPGIGHARLDLTDKPVRFFSFYRYLIIYNAESDPIEIVRFLSGYRDIEPLL